MAVGCGVLLWQHTGGTTYGSGLLAVEYGVTSVVISLLEAPVTHLWSYEGSDEPR